MTQNSNLIHIVMDYEKQRKRKEERRKRAIMLNEITNLCKAKKIEWHADLDKEIKIKERSFPCTTNGLKQARNFVLSLDIYR